MNPTPIPVRLASVATASPANVLEQEDFARFAARVSATIPREVALIHAVARQSGVSRRRTVLEVRDRGLPFYEECPRESPPGTGERMKVFECEAPPLAVAAARRALDQAGLSPDRVDHVVVATCTGFASPGIDFRLIHELGLSPAVGRTLLGFMGCHAAINATGVALHAARSLAAARGRPAHVLVVSVELCTLHFQRGIGRHVLVPNSLFADGAGAWIASTDPAFSGAPEILKCASVDLGRDTRELMTWRIGNHGFEMRLDSSVPAVLAGNIPAIIGDLVSEFGLGVRDVARWALHPGGPRIIDGIRAALSLPRDAVSASEAVLDQFGNMSSATIPFVWEAMGMTGDGGPCVSAAFGPGLVAELMLTR